jgi:hypothetical protein
VVVDGRTDDGSAAPCAVGFPPRGNGIYTDSGSEPGGGERNRTRDLGNQINPAAAGQGGVPFGFVGSVHTFWACARRRGRVRRWFGGGHVLLCCARARPRR